MPDRDERIVPLDPSRGLTKYDLGRKLNAIVTTAKTWEEAAERFAALATRPTSPGGVPAAVSRALEWAMDEVDVLANKLCHFAYPQAMHLVGRVDQGKNYVAAIHARRETAIRARIEADPASPPATASGGPSYAEMVDAVEQPAIAIRRLADRDRGLTRVPDWDESQVTAAERAYALAVVRNGAKFTKLNMLQALRAAATPSPPPADDGVEARNAVLEEAAKIADADSGMASALEPKGNMAYGPNIPPRIARAIRALKHTPQPRQDGAEVDAAAARSGERRRDYIYDPADWDITHEWASRGDLLDGNDRGHIRKFATLREAGDVWGVADPENGYGGEFYDSEAEARQAAALLLAAGDEGEDDPSSTRPDRGGGHGE